MVARRPLWGLSARQPSGVLPLKGKLLRSRALWYGHASLVLSLLTNKRVTGAILALLCASGTAVAQSSDDLFAPAPPQPEKPQPPPLAVPFSSSGGAQAPPSPAQRDKAAEQALGPGERDASLGDRVKAVQRKAFVKAHRFGVTGFGSASISDAFFQKWGGGGQLAYSFADPFALAVNYAYFHDQVTENVPLAKQVLSSQLFATRLHSLATADFQWTPVYGKAQLANKIIYFDVYVLAGLGAAQGETNWVPASEAGLGERIFFTDFLSVGVEAKYDFYVDQANNAPSVLQRALLVSGLLTIWFPGGPSEGP